MNDSSWGAPPRAGLWGPTDQGTSPGYGWEVPPSSAGPAHEVAEAAQTRPMPTVPHAGGDPGDAAGRDRGAARPGGPLFRDEQEPRPGPRQPPGQPPTPPGPESADSTAPG